MKISDLPHNMCISSSDKRASDSNVFEMSQVQCSLGLNFVAGFLFCFYKHVMPILPLLSISVFCEKLSISFIL